MALFQPGQSGNPGGRKKSLLKRIDAELADSGISPLQEILKRLPELDARDQVQTWLQIMSYCHAKPKEVAQEADPYASLSDQEIITLLIEKVPQLKAAG